MGKVIDAGVTDLNNMGAAMAPAACDTLCAFFADTQTTPWHYDLIITGDLGNIGKDLLRELLFQNGYAANNLEDCGSLIFGENQDAHSGGSGCGCSAITLCGDLLNKLNDGRLKRILFCGTGALLSPTSTQQGLPIPAVCHAVSIITGRD